ncbi:MAG: hypothetical protein ACO1TE_16280 [Prosthecobacter sp.]
MKTKTIYTLLGVFTLLAWLGLELTAGTTREIVSGWFLLAFLLSGLAFILGSLLWLVFLRKPPLAGLVCGCIGLALMLHGILPGGEGVVERVAANDGTEMMIVQRYGGEPYSVGFYFRKAGGDWGQFYYEHEDMRWIRGLSHIRLSADQKQATVYRLFWPVAMFDLEKETFTIHRWQRTSSVQSTMPKDWTPEKA